MVRQIDDWAASRRARPPYPPIAALAGTLMGRLEFTREELLTLDQRKAFSEIHVN